MRLCNSHKFYLRFIYLRLFRNQIYYRFAEMIEKSLNIVFLCEMVGCTIIICFLEFGVLKVFLLNQNYQNYQNYQNKIQDKILQTYVYVNLF